MKKKIGICLMVLLIAAIFSCDTNSGSGSGETPEYNDDIILHTKWPFPVGVAVSGANTSNISGGSSANNALLPGNPQHRLLRHFNAVVAENEMKPSNLLPGSCPAITGTDFNSPVDADFAIWKANYKWANADALVTYAQANDKKVRGHTLFWHSQSPDWFFLDGSNKLISKDLLYYRMDLHIRAVFERYAGKIHSWDVVNEVIAQSNNSGPREPVKTIGNRSGEESYYTNIMSANPATSSGLARFDFVRHAFERSRYWANFYNDSDVQLYLTDFGVERPFTRGSTTKQQDFYDLIEWLVKPEINAPIDGIGFQGHFRIYDHPVDKNSCLVTACINNRDNCNHNIKDGIEKFSNFKRADNTKLKIIICELDFSIFSTNFNAPTNILNVGNSLNSRLTVLAKSYRDFFDMFKEFHEKGVIDMVLIWGLADGHSWLNAHPESGRTDYPLLFDRSYQGKEAYQMLVN